MTIQDDVELDSIPDDAEAGTVAYWKSRSRQWQKRCKRAENEKGELIAELNALKLAMSGKPARAVRIERHERMLAVATGDVYNGVSREPRAL